MMVDQMTTFYFLDRLLIAIQGRMPDHEELLERGMLNAALYG